MSKGEVWFYHFAVVKYDKTVPLPLLTMNYTFPFDIFQVGMSVEKILLFQVSEVSN